MDWKIENKPPVAPPYTMDCIAAAKEPVIFELVFEMKEKNDLTCCYATSGETYCVDGKDTQRWEDNCGSSDHEAGTNDCLVRIWMFLRTLTVKLDIDAVYLL